MWQRARDKNSFIRSFMRQDNLPRNVSKAMMNSKKPLRHVPSWWAPTSPLTSFLDLPAELRNEIYALVLPELCQPGVLIRITRETSRRFFRLHVKLGLLSTCRQIRQEVSSLFWIGPRFVFPYEAATRDVFAQWLLVVGTAGLLHRVRPFLIEASKGSQSDCEICHERLIISLDVSRRKVRVAAASHCCWDTTQVHGVVLQLHALLDFWGGVRWRVRSEHALGFADQVTRFALGPCWYSGFRRVTWELTEPTEDKDDFGVVFERVDEHPRAFWLARNGDGWLDKALC